MKTRFFSDLSFLTSVFALFSSSFSFPLLGYCLCVCMFGYICLPVQVYVDKLAIVGPSCLCFLALRLQLHITVPGFHAGSEDLNWVLMFAQQAPYPLSHLSPQLFFLKKYLIRQSLALNWTLYVGRMTLNFCRPSCVLPPKYWMELQACATMSVKPSLKRRRVEKEPLSPLICLSFYRHH